ncbi:hypothetical protein ACN9MJ_14790 [Acidovorax facilis]|uniref:hypothetical protein n=1 Tax=Acidovorax facilis TaxID=12917 RepID=UPI003CF536E0
MSITITIASTVSANAFESVVVLAGRLERGDANFKDRAIAGRRGPLTSVIDATDDLRAALLRLLVDGTLNHRSTARPVPA